MRFTRIKACLLVILSAPSFLEFQRNAGQIIGIPAASDDNTAHIVHRAFWSSLLLVLASCIVGALAGWIGGAIIGPVNARFISALQVIGALLLLWGTLFVRGWQIQTYKGITLIERINQWIYRSLYCVGTALLVASVIWPQR